MRRPGWPCLEFSVRPCCPRTLKADMSLLQRQSSCRAASSSNSVATVTRASARRCIVRAARASAAGQADTPAATAAGRLLAATLAATFAVTSFSGYLSPAALAEEGEAAVSTPVFVMEATPVSDTVAVSETPGTAAVSEAPASQQEAPAVQANGSRQVFFDVKIEGKPAGRITVELFDDVPVGSQRFADLAVGSQGVNYRLNRFDYVVDDYIRVEGVKSLSYSATGESLIAGGDSVQALEEEMGAWKHSHDGAGCVSLVVKEATERPITEKLVAKNGKLVTVQLQAGEAPNGTSFTITRKAAPELDATNLVVGRVVGGMDTVEQVGHMPVNKPPEGWYNKPYFEVGKAIGDKRATVAEKFFNRPFKRAIIANGGLL